MTILSANTSDGSPVDRQQINTDVPELERLHAIACEEDPVWACFGGTLTVGDRVYQVM